MIILSAVLESKAHGVILSQGFDRVVCLLPTHLQQAWIGCWKEQSDRAQLRFHLVRPHSLTWIMLTMSLSLLNSLNFSFWHNGRWGSVFGTQGELAEDKDTCVFFCKNLLTSVHDHYDIPIHMGRHINPFYLLPQPHWNLPSLQYNPCLWSHHLRAVLIIYELFYLLIHVFNSFLTMFCCWHMYLDDPHVYRLPF